MKKVVEILKKIKIRNIIILIVLLAFNAYAWFLYNTRVAMDLNVHVSSWEIEFYDSHDEKLATQVIVDVERAYPGMETFEKVVSVKNSGEIEAELEYYFKRIDIMGEVYDAEAEGSTLTYEDIENKLKEYPFNISVTINDENLKDNGTGSFSVKVEWPYESGNDELDTYWGNKAYEYYSLNPRK